MSTSDIQKVFLTLMAGTVITLGLIAPDVSNPSGVDRYGSIRFGCPAGYVCDTDFPSFSEAATAAVLANESLLVKKQWTGLPSQVVSAHLIFLPDGSINPAPGGTITITNNAVVNPEWFGAKKDGR
jgi:hypothetical protein